MNLAAELKLVEQDADLACLVEDAASASFLTVDLEASGLHAYRARICTVQLAWEDSAKVAVVDALALPVAALGALLAESGPTKIVHDVAFDARLLAENGVDLGNVHDTSVAARMLGRSATGLASLLRSELGLEIDKGRQTDDWRIRPLTTEMLTYLTEDVAHLQTLHDVLWGEITEHGIEPEVLEETRYRLTRAQASTRSNVVIPPYARVKGADTLTEPERAVLRAIAELRENEALRRDVPPHAVASAETLLAIARAHPKNVRDVLDLRNMRSLSTSPSEEVRAFLKDLALAACSAATTIPEDERSLFERPKPAPADVKARRDREGRLMAWRKKEAARRGVDEQVVLPGHCAKEAAGYAALTLDELTRIPGIGAFRVLRDGEAIVHALRGATP